MMYHQHRIIYVDTKMCFLNQAVVLLVTLCFCLVFESTAQQDNFCNDVITESFTTQCESCAINVFVDCPANTTKVTGLEGTQGCTYELSLGPGPNITRPGCTHTCRRTITRRRCCPGYWGGSCTACPGGGDAVCTGHGACDDGVAGSGVCNCHAGYAGYACELCTNTTAPGSNCSAVPDANLCMNVTCVNNSRCEVVDGEALCMCTWPYVGQPTDNNTLHCKQIDVCTVPPLCHSNAVCNFSQSSEWGKECTCSDGYHGDGFLCDPVDPCATDNGGCQPDTTRCVYTAPGQSRCECLSGYTEYVPGHGCSLRDVCQTNSSICHDRAVCTTVAPNQVKCTCPDGYAGDGKTCYGNILQTIQDLDTYDPELKGQLSLIHTAMSTFYSTELTQHAPFTVFVSTNGGFRSTHTGDYQKWLQDGVRVRQVLRQHMVVGEFTMDHLLNQSVFYTLEGMPAELLVAHRGDVFKYRVLGSNRKGRVERGDVLASNGVVHVINRLMTNTPAVTGDAQLTVLQVVGAEGRYNRLQSLLTASGKDFQDILQSQDQNITMFAPNNAALDQLPQGSLEYLVTSEGQDQLVALLTNHIINRTVEIAELINMQRVTSLTNSAISIAVTQFGQVRLGGIANVTQADITCRNGLLLDIDGVLLPDGLSTLPSRCDDHHYRLIQGPCGDCRDEQRCYSPDVKTNVTVDCQYYMRGADGKFTKTYGCASMCNRTFILHQCCDGFYGSDCLPCPGGYQNACNGHGKCEEGYFGRGGCKCAENFAGAACDRCSRDKYWGADCTQECSCIHGVCNAGPAGDGQCNPQLQCLPGYMGDDCERTTVPCTDQTYCHAYATCIWTDVGKQFGCFCQPGYIGDGETCVEVNPCLQDYRGDCHLQATCQKTGPGENNCTCNQGWTGDGKYCYPATSCRNHADCHNQSDCIETIPGQHVCRCKPGYHGDGLSCILTDMCTKDNGGCHTKATCAPTGPGRVNCTCQIDNGYSGNGFSCHGNVVTEIENNPDLEFVASIMKSTSLAQRQLLLDNNYTIFVPTDLAMWSFMNKASVEHWSKPDNIITMLNYHTLMNSSRVDTLVALTSVYKRLPTVADGFYLHFFRQGENLTVSNRETYGTAAKILHKDIVATNGYINVIDTVLEPYMPTAPEDYPDLETFFNTTPQYSIFGSWLKERGLMTQLEDTMNQYTLFMPNNVAARAINRTVTSEFLQYYILPVRMMMANVDDGRVASTLLGDKHRLVYNVLGWNNVTVNSIPIEAADIFTYGGIVNGISGLLHPILNTCNETTQAVEWGVCVKCGGPTPCPVGYETAPDSAVQPCMSTVKTWFGVSKVPGCQGLCVTQKTILGCCAGHYGADCAECPGGPEYPCHNAGSCSDGVNGTGVCSCQGHHTGPSCSQCNRGWTGPHCDVDKSGCGYQNGGCHFDGVCSRASNGTISCKCGQGYHGDGYNCSGPCDRDNGRCHDYATCSYSSATGTICTCVTGFVGNGRDYCNADVVATLATIPKASLFLKALRQSSTNITVLVGHMASRQLKYSLFVPVDASLTDRVITMSAVQSHIVVANTSVILDSTATNPRQYTTLSGDPLSVVTDAKHHVFYVNQTRVLKGNILCTNGVVHLINSSLVTLPRLQGAPQPAGTAVATIVVPVVLVLVLLLVAMAAVVYRRSLPSYWDQLRNWIPSRQVGDVEHKARLHTAESRDSCSSGLPNMDFGNPLFHDDS